jgi:hypothetical protein
VLREPIERAYSHYCMLLRGGRVSADVDQVLTLDSKLVREGFYYSHIMRFLDHFPREQVHVLLYDDMQSDRAAFFQHVCRLIGVDPGFVPPSLRGTAHVRKGKPRFPALFRMRVAATRFITRRSSLADRIVGRMRGSRWISRSRLLNQQASFPVWSEQAKQRIAEALAPDVEQLATFIGRDLSHWLRPYLLRAASATGGPPLQHEESP